MPVKIYIGKDSTEREWAPDFFHEGDAVVRILQDMWSKFNHLPNLYVVMANLHKPSADMVIMTERGLGVVEFKHYPGAISISSNNIWHAGNKPIPGGTLYLNPHQQVQAYAEIVRNRILKNILPIYMRNEINEWDKLKFQTTVCFTNPNAYIDKIKDLPPVQCKPWEHSFSITVPADIPRWAINLRFEVNKNKNSFDPYLLSGETLINLATYLGGLDWGEVLPLMPTEEPYAYLVLKEGNNSVQQFGLYKDVSTIGRSPDNDIPIPSNYPRVSRNHALIKRDLSRVIIEDLGSSHGTFVDGKAISKPYEIKHGQQISLSPGGSDNKACILEFLLRTESLPSLEPTQSSTDSE